MKGNNVTFNCLSIYLSNSALAATMPHGAIDFTFIYTCKNDQKLLFMTAWLDLNLKNHSRVKCFEMLCRLYKK